MINDSIDSFGNKLFNQTRNAKLRYRDLLSKKTRHNCLISGCCNKAIGSHSISRKTLEYLAKDGHVVCPVLNVCNIGNTEKDLYETSEPNLEIKRVGISKAGVFNGFCSFHDNSFFENLDNKGIKTKRDIFLQLYRTVSKYYFTTNMISQSELETFNYEYNANTEFENLMELSLEEILFVLKKLITDEQNYNESVDIGFDNSLCLEANLDVINKPFSIIYKRLSPDFKFAMENNLILGDALRFNNSFLIVLPEEEFTNLIVLCHKDLKGQFFDLLKGGIQTLNFLESVLMHDSIFYLPPEFFESWSADKLKIITDDFFFVFERKFRQEYDISIFDELRMKLIENCNSETYEHEYKKIKELPVRNCFKKRFDRQTWESIKQRQRKIKLTGNQSGLSYPIGALTVE